MLNRSGSEKQLESDDIIPICLEKADKKSKGGASEDEMSWRALLGSLSRRQLTILALAVVQNTVCWAVELTMVFFFAAFILARFAVPLWHSALMLAMMTASFGVTNIALPKLVERIIPNFVVLIAASSALLCAVFVVLARHANDVVVYWLLAPLWGALFGVASIASEMAILEAQPKKHSGKVSGAKSALEQLCRAVAVLVVGVCWDDEYGDSLWIGCAIMSAIVACLSVLMQLVIRTGQKADAVHDDEVGGNVEA